MIREAVAVLLLALAGAVAVLAGFALFFLAVTWPTCR